MRMALVGLVATGKELDPETEPAFPITYKI
jgi:hypothetical protein